MNAPKQIAFTIVGMDCAEEVSALKREIAPLVGGEAHLAFDILNGQMIVSDLSKEVSVESIVEAVERAGLGAQVISGDSPKSEPSQTSWQHHRRALLTALSGICFFAAFT